MMPNQPYGANQRTPAPRVRTAAPCPKLSREQLYCQIMQTGFALVDMNLYLDTHPDDKQAIRYFQENKQVYQNAVAEYSQSYGPLTLSDTCSNEQYWDWVNQPWPWQ